MNNKTIYITGLFFFLLFFTAGSLFFFITSDFVDLSVLERNSHGSPSVVLDASGGEMMRFEYEKRLPVEYEELSPFIIKAFMAAEDHIFFDHWGISLKGMIRSTLVNLRNGRVVQGASTITQQLVKLLLLSHERSFKRKFLEIFMAFTLEQKLSKEQIFELYLNTIYFGRGIYGIGAACKRFWNKRASEVTLDEAATLAAVAKSARFYSPLNDLLKAQRRRDVVLKSMLLLHFISSEDYETAVQKKLEIEAVSIPNTVRAYLFEAIRVWAEGHYGHEVLYKGGLEIQTTINSKTQKMAEDSFTKKVAELRVTIDPAVNGGLIALEPSSGKVRALIGGFDFRESQFNRALQAVRQMGSAFKPFVYTAALQAGISMTKTEVDEPLEISFPDGGLWQPKNWTDEFEGEMTLLRALTTSNNIVSIKTLLHTGCEPVIKLAQQCGIVRNLKAYPSLALGITEATTLETAAAFNVFANYGTYVKPYFIEWVKDKNGRKLWSAPVEKRTVIEPQIVSKMTHALAWRMRRMKRLKAPGVLNGVEAIGKTGSTNGCTSTWFVGATPELTTAVYIGLDNNKKMGAHIFGSQTTYPVWLDFYRKLSFKEKYFYYDPLLKERFINWRTAHPLKGEEDFESASVLE